MKNKKVSVRVLFPLIMSITIAVCIVCCMILFFYGLSRYFVKERVDEIGKQKNYLAQEIEKEIEQVIELTNSVYIQNIKIQKSLDDEFLISIDDFINRNKDRVHSIALYDEEGECIGHSGNITGESVEGKEAILKRYVLAQKKLFVQTR